MRHANMWLGAAATLALARLIWWGAASNAVPAAVELPPPHAATLGSAPNACSDESQRQVMQHLDNRLARMESATSRHTQESASPTREPDERRDAEAHAQIDARALADDRARSYDAVLRAESVDSQWSAAMQTRFQEFFRTEVAVGSSIQRVECRSTMCRLEIESESRAARETFAQGVAGIAPPSTQGFVHIDNDEALEFVIYLSREGQALPVPDKS